MTEMHSELNTEKEDAVAAVCEKRDEQLQSNEYQIPNDHINAGVASGDDVEQEHIGLDSVVANAGSDLPSSSITTFQESYVDSESSQKQHLFTNELFQWQPCHR